MKTWVLNLIGSIVLVGCIQLQEVSKNTEDENLSISRLANFASYINKIFEDTSECDGTPGNECPSDQEISNSLDALDDFAEQLENLANNELPAAPAFGALQQIKAVGGVIAAVAGQVNRINPCARFAGLPPVPNLCFLTKPGCGTVRVPCSLEYLCKLATGQIRPAPPVCESFGPNGWQPINWKFCNGNGNVPFYLCGMDTNNCPLQGFRCAGMY